MTETATVAIEGQLGIHRAMRAVLEGIPAIGRDNKNTQQKFNYRSIDQVYNAVFPLFQANGIASTSKIINKEITNEARDKRDSGGGTYKQYVVTVSITCEYTFTSLEDGSSMSTQVVADGQDHGGDKGANKAMAAAHKYAICQMFCIPYENMIDGDRDPRELPQSKNEGTQAPPARKGRANEEEVKAFVSEWQAFYKSIPGSIKGTSDDLREWIRLNGGRDFDVKSTKNWSNQDLDHAKEQFALHKKDHEEK